MKKIISLIMCFCILFCSLTFVSINAGALTYGDFEYETITYGENVGTVRITKYIGSGGNVTIPSEIDGKSVTEIKYAFQNCISLTSVTIPGCIKTIDYNTFSGCVSLKNVTINNGVTVIGDYAFKNCSMLTSISIPGSVTSIGDWAFYNCVNLKSIFLPDSVTSIGDWAFEYTNVTISFSCLATGIKNYCITNEMEYKIVHQLSDWIIDSAPITCNKGKYRVCQKCGYKQYSAISHNMTAWKTTKKPTYFEAGTKTRKCKKCSLVETKKIAKLKLKTPVITKIKKCNLQGKNGKITFKKVKNASYYEIWDYQFIYYNNYYDDDGNFCGSAHVSKWKKRKTTKKTSCKLVNLHPGAVPKVKIRAVYKKGNKIAYSDFTKAKVFN